MVDERKIGLAIPTYQRVDLTLKSFEYVYDDERVGQITICDDDSDETIFNQLAEQCRPLRKVVLSANPTNKDCYENKWRTLIKSDFEWNILLDSDNRISHQYLDRLFEIKEWDKDTIYAPCFAAPTFDFREYSGLLITKENVAKYMDRPLFETMLNAANYFVNKYEYVRIWDADCSPVTSDSIYMAYRWLESGNKIYVVPGLEYFHRVHDGSHYKNNVHRTPKGFHEEILNKLRSLS